MIAPFKYLKSFHTEEGQGLFSIILECRTHTNGLMLQDAIFHLNIKKNFLSVKAVHEWNQLVQKVMSTATLETFKKKIYFNLDSCIEQGGRIDGLTGSFQLHYSMIL